MISQIHYVWFVIERPGEDEFTTSGFVLADSHENALEKFAKRQGFTADDVHAHGYHGVVSSQEIMTAKDGE